MRSPIHLLAQQLTGKPTLEECSLEEVKRIVQRYPYFAPAQFLLLQKLRQSGALEEADAQYKKAVLFYPDPPAFEWFIASGKFYSDAENEPFSTAHGEILQTNEGSGEGGANEQTLAAEENSGAYQPERLQNSSVAIPLPAYGNGTGEEEPTEPFTESDGNFLPAVTDKNEETASFAVQETVDAPPASQKPEAVSPAINEDLPKEGHAAEPLAFEPYHTVDYFASQGIKISPDELRKDKLGKQLKSFTEWLKTMKRLPASQTADVPESVVEKGVEKLADRSLSDSEVLTEAMAEVWAKQGAPQKALDIYNKLSLYNPSKRDYFAAKIENLKQF